MVGVLFQVEFVGDYVIEKKVEFCLQTFATVGIFTVYKVLNFGTKAVQSSPCAPGFDNSLQVCLDFLSPLEPFADRTGLQGLLDCNRSICLVKAASQFFKLTLFNWILFNWTLFYWTLFNGTLFDGTLFNGTLFNGRRSAEIKHRINARFDPLVGVLSHRRGLLLVAEHGSRVAPHRKDRSLVQTLVALLHGPAV